MPRFTSLSLAVLVAPLAAGAQVIGFSAADPNLGFAATTFARGAYTIAFSPDQPDALESFFTIGNPSVCSPVCTSDGQYNIYVLNPATLSLAGGPAGGFTLRSIDAAQVFTTLDAPLDVLVTGQLVGGGSVSARIRTEPGTADVFRTFLLPGSFAGLSSVTLESMPIVLKTSPAPQYLFAVHEFTVAPTVAAPEPTTFALAVGGVALGGVAARRRRRRAT